MVVVPMAIVVARVDRSRRSNAWVKLGRSGRVFEWGWGRWICALVVLILGLAGPRIGRSPDDNLPPGHDVVLLIDASRSMAAEDAIPNRLGAAKAAARQLIGALGTESGARLAVVAFAGGVEPLCPLTDRFEFALERLQALKPGDVRPGGTDIGLALLAGLEVFDDQGPSAGRSIVILTDGEDLAPANPLVFEKLKAAGIMIHAVTFGDAEIGQWIPLGPKREPLRYLGEPVKTRRSDQELRRICEATGGILLPVGRSRADLESLYRERIAPTETAQRATTNVPERVDRSAWLIAASLGLLTPWSWPKPRRLTAVVTLFLLVGFGAGPFGNSAREATFRGETFYRNGDYKHALVAFEEVEKLAPSSSLGIYNTAATLFQLGRFDDAEERYERARQHADPALTVKIDFALGNVATMSKRYQEAIEHYDKCLNSMADGPVIQAVKNDARLNRVFAQKKLPPPASPDPEGPRKVPDRPSSGDSEQPKNPPANPDAPDQPSPAAPPPPASSKEQTPAPPRAAAPNPSSASSPEKRLDEMLKEVRKAQSAAGERDRRPESTDSPERKDW
jgi:Ca-activated chloride channel family protein